MHADDKGLDSLSEKVLSAVFEVSNTLGAGFLEKVYRRALLRELSLRGLRATAEASFAVIFKGTPWESIFGSPGRGFAGGGIEMCRTPGQRTHGAMFELSASLWPHRVSSRQFSEAQSRMEANRSRFFRFAQGTRDSGVESIVCPVNSGKRH